MQPSPVFSLQDSASSSTLLLVFFFFFFLFPTLFLKMPWVIHKLSCSGNRVHCVEGAQVFSLPLPVAECQGLAAGRVGSLRRPSRKRQKQEGKRFPISPQKCDGWCFKLWGNHSPQTCEGFCYKRAFSTKGGRLFLNSSDGRLSRRPSSPPCCRAERRKTTLTKKRTLLG